ILRAHPGWRMIYKDGRPMPYADAYIFVSPANPEFQAHIQAVVAEIASFYDIDGLHFDYIRYPSPDTSYDKVSNRLYKKARKKNSKLTRAAWQRGELTSLVRRMKERVQEVRPTVLVSAAVTGVYKDRWEWGEVVKGFFDFHQDSHGWAQAQAVDILIPMIYWKPTNPPGGRSDYLTLVKDFAQLLGQVQVLSGINVEAGGFEVLEKEIRIAREHGYPGVVLFAYDALKQRGWFEKLKAGVFKEAALPRAPRKVAVKP
ncbi:glycoside hydrolase family 10 protein, partial [Myxococcota bacterium]